MKHYLTSVLAACAIAFPAMAGDSIAVNWEAGAVFNTGSETLAPHHITASSVITQRHGAQAFGSLWHDMDSTARFSWSAGVTALGGYTSATPYLRYDTEAAALLPVDRHPGRLQLLRLSAAVKYRCLYLLVGKDYHRSPLVDGDLSSGDLIMSGHTPLPPGARAGFIDFQNVPFTGGWLQITGEAGYYRSDDSKWLENRYNRLNNFITTGFWLNYKRVHFRSNPQKPLVATVGMQASCQFGGTHTRYVNGVEVERLKMKADAEAFFKALVPGSGGNASGDHFYEGNHVGSWDIKLDYHLHGGTLTAYHQHPWEDGSGIGFKNGFDGLWGLSYHAARRYAPLSGVVAEYLDLTNHSGPLHFNRHDYTDDTRPDGSPVDASASGSDDYYNNYAFAGYSYRGQSIGSPMVMAPLYNTDGYMRYLHNVMRGFHLGAEGYVTPQWQWQVKATWRKSWGNVFMPLQQAVSATSWMACASWKQAPAQGWRASLALALDSGKLTGDNFGALLSVSYLGNFSIHR